MINLNDIPYRHTAFLLHPPSPLIGEMGGSAKLVSDWCLRRVWVFRALSKLVSDRCLRRVWLFRALSKLVSDGVLDEFGVILLVKLGLVVSLGFVGLLAVTWFWCANIVRRR